MLTDYYRFIITNFNEERMALCINKDSNSIDIILYGFIRFRLLFKESMFEVKIIAANGNTVNTIGGKTICETISNSNIHSAVNGIISYSRLLIGNKYFMRNEDDD